MWTISKEIDFCFGHRVYTQRLDPEFSVDNKCKCRHLHGHNGTIIVNCESNNLTNGMVTDFKHLNWLKVFVDEYLDHKFIIGRDDPLFHNIVPRVDELSWIPVMIGDIDTNAKIVNPLFYKTIRDENLVELMESFVVVDFAPTSENFCEWLFKIVDFKMQRLATVKSVMFKETPKTTSCFQRN